MGATQGKHTLGPWRAVQLEKSYGIYDPTGCAVANVKGTHGFAPGRHIADARLIAAAPDMLEALRNARDALAAAVRHAWEGSNAADIAEHIVIKQMDAAIAKALGSAQ